MRAWEAGDATVDSWGFFLEGLGVGKVCEPVQGRWCWPGTAIHRHQAACCSSWTECAHQIADGRLGAPSPHPGRDRAYRHPRPGLTPRAASDRAPG